MYFFQRLYRNHSHWLLLQFCKDGIIDNIYIEIIIFKKSACVNAMKVVIYITSLFMALFVLSTHFKLIRVRKFLTYASMWCIILLYSSHYLFSKENGYLQSFYGCYNLSLYLQEYAFAEASSGRRLGIWVLQGYGEIYRTSAISNRLDCESASWESSIWKYSFCFVPVLWLCQKNWRDNRK